MPRRRKVLGTLGMLKTKKGLMIAVPALVVLLGGGGAGAYFFMAGSHGEEAAGEHAEEVPLTPPKVAFSDMQDILVNIQSSDGTPAYLKLGVSLELDDEEHKAALEPLMPRITDQFQAYLRELRLDCSQGLGRRAAPQGRAAAPRQCGGRPLQGARCAAQGNDRPVSAAKQPTQATNEEIEGTKNG